MSKRWKCEQNDEDWFSITDNFINNAEYTMVVTVMEGEKEAQAALGIDSLIELRDHLNKTLEGL